LAYRKVGKLDTEKVLKKLSGWSIFPHSEEGAAAAVGIMSGDESAGKELEVSWDDDRVVFVVAANPGVWGNVPEGSTPMTIYFSVYLSDDIDSDIYYSVLVDNGELVDVVMSEDGEIIGNIYSQQVPDSDEFADDDDDDLRHSLAIITDSGMIGRAYFAYSPDSPVANKIIRLYTSALAGIAREILVLDEFNAAVSDFESGQSVRASLEIILVNDKEQAQSLDWYSPVEGLRGWKLFLPYTEDGFTNCIYQQVTEHPVKVVESMMYAVNENKLPWLGKSMRFLVRPKLKDIRMTSYSPILVTIEPIASRVASLIELEPTDESRILSIDDLEVTIHYGNERQPAFHNGKEKEIIAHRLVAIQDDIDLMVSFDYISHNETDAYTKDIEVILANLIRSLQGVHV